MCEAASRGFWVGSRTPYGYKRVMVQDGTKKRPKLEPDKAAAPVIKRIFELADAGRGMLDISRVLNDEGIATATGKRWSKTGVHNVLTNEVYTGTLLKRVWEAEDSADVRPMRTIISSLRRKLGDNADNPTYIFNEPRVGYKMPRAGTREREGPESRRGKYSRFGRSS